VKSWSCSRLVLLSCLAAVPMQLARAEILKVGGTGSSAPLVANLFEAFRKQVPGVELEQPSPPLGSGGALKALAGGRLDLAFAGRPLKPDEEARVGPSFKLATTPFVLASAGGRKQDGFTRDELAGVYAGTRAVWDNGAPIRLVLRASFESDTEVLRAMSPAMAAAVDVAARRPGMAMGQDDLETLTLLTRTPGSFGPTTLGLLRGMGSQLTLFAIDGVTPSLANLQNGRYVWRKDMTVVLSRQPTPLAKKFAAFLRSDKARAVLLHYDYLPLEE